MLLNYQQVGVDWEGTSTVLECQDKNRNILWLKIGWMWANWEMWLKKSASFYSPAGSSLWFKHFSSQEQGAYKASSCCERIQEYQYKRSYVLLFPTIDIRISGICLCMSYFRSMIWSYSTVLIRTAKSVPGSYELLPPGTSQVEGHDRR